MPLLKTEIDSFTLEVEKRSDLNAVIKAVNPGLLTKITTSLEEEANRLICVRLLQAIIAAARKSKQFKENITSKFEGIQLRAFNAMFYTFIPEKIRKEVDAPKVFFKQLVLIFKDVLGKDAELNPQKENTQQLQQIEKDLQEKTGKKEHLNAAITAVAPELLTPKGICLDDIHRLIKLYFLQIIIEKASADKLFAAKMTDVNSNKGRILILSRLHGLYAMNISPEIRDAVGGMYKILGVLAPVVNVVIEKDKTPSSCNSRSRKNPNAGCSERSGTKS